jgi:tetratricopeptide (TPR) repeat protein
LVPDYFDLGDYTRAVTTRSAQAQAWFTRGLLWSYAFNYEEAARCFERAIADDPDLALAHWGLAYALGPNYNKPWEAFDPVDLSTSVSRAFAASAAAASRASGAPAVERALVRALAARYPSATPAPDCSAWNIAYADAMREVYSELPDDLDVAVLFADALMNLTPWALWDQATGEPAAGAATLEAKAALERALARADGRRHPGALHMYIHLMEMSARPEDALWAGDLLRDLVPDAGHLRHMPTHLDVLCGDYRQVVSSNTAAIAADERFVAREGAMNLYTVYRAHNYHFKIYGAMFLGQAQTAVATADLLAAAIPEELLRVEVPPMADWLEGFVPMKMHALIRFGRWQDIIDAPLPADQDLYCATTAMMRYAKGVAYAATGQIGDAAEQRRLFAAAVQRVPQSRTVFNNTCIDILRVAEVMLDGELEYRRGHYDEAFALLRRAIELDDGLAYDEPWAGCSRPGTPTAPCCSSRAGSAKPRRSTVPTSALMKPWPGPASIRVTSGACTVTMSAWCGWASMSWPALSRSSSRSPGRTPTCRSGHRATAASLPARQADVPLPALPGCIRSSGTAGLGPWRTS